MVCLALELVGSRVELGFSVGKQKILRRGGKNTQKNYTKMVFMTQVITMV